MIDRLLDLLFGCSHERLGWPRGKHNGPKHRTCCECGKQIPFTAWDREEIAVERCMSLKEETIG